MTTLTQEDIIEMAREAGLISHYPSEKYIEEIGHFTNLVAAAEFAKREWNFCERCGKRTADLTTIHTCTPPRDNT